VRAARIVVADMQNFGRSAIMGNLDSEGVLLATLRLVEPGDMGNGS
jgi:hypothetical protein